MFRVDKVGQVTAWTFLENKAQKNLLNLLSFGVPEILIISLVSNLKKKNSINGKEIIKCAIKKSGFSLINNFLSRLKFNTKIKICDIRLFKKLPLGKNL